MAHFNSLLVSRYDKKIDFQVHNIDVAIVNAIRRICLAEIPNVAVAFDSYHPAESDVRIITNNSSLHNEFIGHRISLLPIFLDEDEITSYTVDKYKFVINKKNVTNQMVNVTTDDIIGFDANNEMLDTHLVHQIFPHDNMTGDPIIITKLKPNPYNADMGDELHVEFSARKGIAKHHARWCPVSTCSYFNMVDQEAYRKSKEDLLKSSDIDPKDKHNRLNRLETIDKFKSFVTNEYGDPSAFQFVLESECKLSPQTIFRIALDVITSKLESLRDDESKMESFSQQDQGLHFIQINNEDHTLGNVLQTLLYNKYVRDSKEVEFVGYWQPHPLENSIVLKIKFSKKDVDALSFIQDALSNMLSFIKDLRKEWVDFTASKTVANPKTNNKGKK